MEKILIKSKQYLNTQAKKINLKKYFKSKLINISILLTGNNDIKFLNKKFRKKNKTTDVLSFPSYDQKKSRTKLKSQKNFILVILRLICIKLIKEKINLKVNLINFGFMVCSFNGL